MQLFDETVKILHDADLKEPTPSQKIFEAWLMGSDEERAELERQYYKMCQSKDAEKVEPEPTAKT